MSFFQIIWCLYISAVGIDELLRNIPFPCQLVRVGRELHCAANAVVDGNTPCAKCGKGYAIESGCACARVSECKGGTWWRAAQNRFECLISF